MKTGIVLTLTLIFSINISMYAQSASDGYKITIAGKTEGNISRKDILAAGKLTVESEIKHDLEIITYHMYITGRRVNYNEFEWKGEDFSHAMIDCIKALPVGAHINFEHIKLLYADEKVWHPMPPMTFTLTE